MKTVTVRPEGSIETLKQIDEIVYDAFKNKTQSVLYAVGQLGLIRAYDIDEHSLLEKVEGMNIHLYPVVRSSSGKQFCPGDYSVDDGQDNNFYNDHFLFTDKDQAEKFSKFLENDPAHNEAVHEHHAHLVDLWDSYIDERCWEDDCHEMNEVEGQEIRMQDNWV